MGKKGKVVITADHGNIEQLIDYDTGMPHTAHTTNLVPVILSMRNGKNAGSTQGPGIDIAPTVLKLLRAVAAQGNDRPFADRGKLGFCPAQFRESHLAVLSKFIETRETGFEAIPAASLYFSNILTTQWLYKIP